MKNKKYLIIPIMLIIVTILCIKPIKANAYSYNITNAYLNGIPMLAETTIQDALALTTAQYNGLYSNQSSANYTYTVTKNLYKQALIHDNINRYMTINNLYIILYRTGQSVEDRLTLYISKSTYKDDAIGCWTLYDFDNALWYLQAGNGSDLWMNRGIYNYTDIYNVDTESTLYILLTKLFVEESTIESTNATISSLESQLEEWRNRYYNIQQNPADYGLYTQSQMIENYTTGYNDALEDSQDRPLRDLIFSTFDAPFNYIFGQYNQNLGIRTGGIFNLTILGTDLTGFLGALLSISIIIAIVKRFI